MFKNEHCGLLTGFPPILFVVKSTNSVCLSLIGSSSYPSRTKDVFFAITSTKLNILSLLINAKFSLHY